MTLNSGPARDWDAGWGEMETTIDHRDVWLLTDYIKRDYLQARLKPGANVLEVGCGSAKLSALLAQQGASIAGLDLSSQALRVAANNFALLGVRGNWIRGDVFTLPLASNSFDVVYSTGLLEHFHDPTPIIAEMARVLKPGGLFFSDIAPLKFSLLRLGFYARRKNRTIVDEYECSASDIRNWLEGCGLQQIQVFASGVVPPLGIIRRVPGARAISFGIQRFWTAFDDTYLAERLGFFYLAFARK